MGKWTLALSATVGFLILIYFVVYAAACPSAELIRAIVFEIVVFIVVFFFKFKGARSKGAGLETMVMQELSQKWASLLFVRSAGNVIVLTFWLLATLGLTIDLTALLAAVSGQPSFSQFVYTTFPSSLLPGVHPAYSLEVLTGAYIEAGKYDRARKTTTELFAINKTLSGEISEPYATVYGTLAKIYAREGRFADAERESRRALAISQKVLAPEKMGQILTLVGDNLRDQGKYAEAQPYYLKALTMRRKQFGPRSIKVADTSASYARSLKLAGEPEQSAQWQKSADAIYKFYERKDDGVINVVISLALFIISIVGSKLLFGPKGFLTKLAVKRLEGNMQNHSVSTEDVRKLIKFYEHQKDPAQIERYEMMLRRLASK